MSPGLDNVSSGLGDAGPGLAISRLMGCGNGSGPNTGSGDSGGSYG